MDPTPEIRNVPLHVKKEYSRITQDLKQNLHEERKVRSAHFQSAIRNLSTEAQTHFKLILKREKIHFDFMKVVFPKCYELKHENPLPEHVPHHDCSKDDMFAFILGMNFDVFTGKDNVVPEESDQEFKDLLKNMVQIELDRHYTLEPHHPEYEKLTGKECQEQDILEMAVDRLSRNVQFNHGNVDVERMKKFLPTFFLGDTKMKEEMYIEFVSLFSKTVSQCAKEMYFKMKEVVPSPKTKTYQLQEHEERRELCGSLVGLPSKSHACYQTLPRSHSYPPTCCRRASRVEQQRKPTVDRGWLIETSLVPAGRCW